MCYHRIAVWFRNCFDKICIKWIYYVLLIEGKQVWQTNCFTEDPSLELKQPEHLQVAVLFKVILQIQETPQRLFIKAHGYRKFEGEKKLWRSSILKARVSTSDCSGLCPVGFWICSRRETSQPLWAMSFSGQTPQSKNVYSYVSVEFLAFQFVSIAFCPATRHH